MNLRGEDYIFIQSQILGGNITNSALLSIGNVFAKLQLVGVPGSVLYNTFISYTKDYTIEPLKNIRFIDLTLRKKNGSLFDLKNEDYSITLEIVEELDYIEGTGISTQRGIRPSLKN